MNGHLYMTDVCTYSEQSVGSDEGWLGHAHGATHSIVISQDSTKYLQEVVSVI